MGVWGIWNKSNESWYTEMDGGLFSTEHECLAAAKLHNVLRFDEAYSDEQASDLEVRSIERWSSEQKQAAATRAREQ